LSGQNSLRGFSAEMAQKFQKGAPEVLVFPRVNYRVHKRVGRSQHVAEEVSYVKRVSRAHQTTLAVCLICPVQFDVQKNQEWCPTHKKAA